MTQPAPPPPPEQGHAGAVITAAVIGLALIALESRVRQEVEDDITTAAAAFTLVVLAALTAIPVGIATGVGLMSWAYLHGALTKTVEGTRDKVDATVRAGYSAASEIALRNAAAELADSGYTVPADLPELGGTIDHISQDIDAMFGHAQTDLQNSIADAYDHDADVTDQRQSISAAISAAVARLRQRAQAAAGTAVHRGASDAQQAVYSDYANHVSGSLGKRWVVTSATPCGMCAALNGTVVALHSQFDHQATDVEKDLRPVWRDLYGPPRHPNCRCQVELVTLG